MVAPPSPGGSPPAGSGSKGEKANLRPKTGKSTLWKTLADRASKPTDIRGRLLKEAEKDADHRRRMRDSVASRIFLTLWVELFLLTALLILQGFGLWGFKLNDWAFGFFVNGALIQTFLVIRHIVRDLFYRFEKEVLDLNDHL